MTIRLCELIYFKVRQTPLHNAAECGDVRMIKTLIRSGADVNAIDLVS